jgi:hypothetical protein
VFVCVWPTVWGLSSLLDLFLGLQSRPVATPLRIGVLSCIARYCVLSLLKKLIIFEVLHNEWPRNFSGDIRTCCGDRARPGTNDL